MGGGLHWACARFTGAGAFPIGLSTLRTLPLFPSFLFPSLFLRASLLQFRALARVPVRLKINRHFQVLIARDDVREGLEKFCGQRKRESLSRVPSPRSALVLFAEFHTLLNVK